MNAVADCKPPCWFAVWCFEWAFTQVFLLFKVWTVVKFFLKVRMVRSHWKMVEYCTLKYSQQSAITIYPVGFAFCYLCFMLNLNVGLCPTAATFWALWIADKTWRALWGSEFSQQIFTASLFTCVFSSLPHPPPRQKKFIWTLVIISVWENNQSVKLSKWNSEKSRASRDLKGQKGSRKKMLVFIMVIVMKPSCKSPDKGLSYCTIKCFLPLGFTRQLYWAD